MDISLVIPIFRPTAEVVPFLKEIRSKDFCEVFVIDDGSGPAYAPIFEEIGKLPDFSVISYPKNQGKGHALKTAFAYIQMHNPEIEGVVTADGDGQHAYVDILRVRDALIANPAALVLGVRDFKAKGVPLHNRLGNHFSANYFFLMTGVHLKDTQTGLRGIPKSLFSDVVETSGERYEFEMNFLLDMAKEAKIVQVPVQTIYYKKKTSHFRPLRDSLRIYKTPLLYALVALTSWAIDVGLFTFFNAVGPDNSFYNLFVSVIGARIISGFYNFIMEFLIIFHSKGLFSRKVVRYVVIFVINMGLSFGLTYLFSSLPFNLTLIKIVVDFFLFVVNFFVARSFVFAKKRTASLNIRKSDSSKGTKKMKKGTKLLIVCGVAYGVFVTLLAVISLLQTFVIQSADESASVNNTDFGNRNSSSVQVSVNENEAIFVVSAF